MDNKDSVNNEKNKKAYEKPTVDETTFEASEDFAFMPFEPPVVSSGVMPT
ncbi:MAG: hypothetical protein FWC09_00900 [Lachnospiraceae bacterium]|nr:hypothetical protein [Lachnospiraceae bacterium]